MALRRPPTRIEIKPEEAIDEFEEFIHLRQMSDPQKINKGARSAAARANQAHFQLRGSVDAKAATIAERIGMNRPPQG